MAIIHCCGAECGIAVVGSLGNGTAEAHWGSINGTPTIETTVVRSGSRSFAFAAAATLPYVSKSWTADNVGYARLYFMVTNATPSSPVNFVEMSISGNNGYFSITTAGVLQYLYSTTVDYNGTLVANEWYGLEFQVDGTGSNYAIDWRVWRASTGWVDQTQGSAGSCDTWSGFDFGIMTGPTSNFTIYMDDIVIGKSALADEDWSDTTPKAGEVKIYRPNADGTHSFSTSGNFRYNNVTGFAQTATNVWTYLDEYPMTQTASFISQNTSSSGLTKYCEVVFSDESTLTNVQGVMAVCAARASATQACEMNLRYSDNGTNWTNLFGNWGATGRDVSETSNGYLAYGLVAPPSGGSWTQTKVNGLRMQFGMSDDISPVPYVVGLAFEVAWQIADVQRVPYINPYPQLLAH
jgi:hypothetical protein